ncbi:MAG: hypothetical protein IAF08_09295 [Rhizobacter sp.]|nr:hypothetical protein [Chlorobiales bacterium]
MKYDAKMRVRMKSEVLAEIEKYVYPDIRGLLIEIELPRKIDLYEQLELLVYQTFCDAATTGVLKAFDWDVGESRFKAAYLVHLWSDEKHLYDMEDFSNAFTAEELEEVLSFTKHLIARLYTLDCESFRIIPSA